MKRLNSHEVNGEMKRSWYIQKSDLKTIKDLKLSAPLSLFEEENLNGNLEDFVLIEDQEAFEYIANQWWILDYLIIKGMSIFEINLAISKDLDKIKDLKIILKDKDTPKEALKQLKDNLIILKNNIVSFNTLKKEELESLGCIRK